VGEAAVVAETVGCAGAPAGAPQGVAPEGMGEERPDSAVEGAEDAEGSAAGGTGVAFMARAWRPPAREAQAGQTSCMLHLSMLKKECDIRL